MGTMDKLRTLDDKVMRQTPKRWDRAVRRWWLFLLLPPLYAVLVLRSDDTSFASGVALFGWFPMFVAGYYYNERLRQLGRRSAIPSMRRPPDA